MTTEPKRTPFPGATYSKTNRCWIYQTGMERRTPQEALNSPLPWATPENSDEIIASNGWVVGSVDNASPMGLTEQRANAALIVESVNGYDATKRQLDTAQELLASLREEKKSIMNSMMKVVVQRDALLEAARAVLADHQERVEIYPDRESQPHRLKVMSELSRAIAACGDYIRWRDYAALQQVNAKLVEAVEGYVTDGPEDLDTRLDRVFSALAAAKELEKSK